MSKIHLFIDACADLDGEDFLCDFVSGGEDRQLAELIGKVVKENPALLKPLLMGAFRASYETGAVTDQDMQYAIDEIEDGTVDVLFELTEMFQ